MSQKNAQRGRQRVAQMRAEQARRKRRLRALAVGGAVVGLGVVAGIVYGVVQGDQDSAQGKPPSGSELTWPAPPNIEPGVKAAGLDLGPMGQAEHYHAHLDVFADSRPVTVPANIGVDARTGAMSAVHTHDLRGVIHVEARTKGQRYTLGQVFTQWQVPLSASQVGPLKAGARRTLIAYVNGKKVSGDPAAIVLGAHQQIALVYGTPNAPFTPPTTYRFQAGE